MQKKRCKDSNGKTAEIIHRLSINFNENVVYNVPYLSFYSTHFLYLSSATTSKPYLWYRRTACNNHVRMGFSCLCLSAMSYLHYSVISTPTVRVRFSMFCYPYVHTTFSGNVSHALFFEGGDTLVCLSVSVGQYIIIKKKHSVTRTCKFPHLLPARFSETTAGSVFCCETFNKVHIFTSKTMHFK